MENATERCDGCGLPVAGGTAGCRALFDELIARDFSDPLYFRCHRMLVDTYCLQHPDPYCTSAKSLAAHLCGLCAVLEEDASRAVGTEALRRWLDGRVALGKPELPAFRGELTIADVHGATDPESHGRAVESWARSTWQAYAPLHPLARTWLAQAQSSGRSRAPR